MRQLAAACLILTLGPGSQAYAKDNEYVSADYGFRIKAPGGWTIYQVPTPKLSKCQVNIFKSRRAAVTVYVNKATSTDAKAVRDARHRALAASPANSGVTSRDSGLAPSLEFTYQKASPPAFRVRQLFWVKNGFVYTVQLGAEAPHFAKDEPALRAIAKTFTTTPIVGGALKRLAEKCGSEIDWAKDWEEAARRARQQKKLVVVVFELYSGFRVKPLAPAAAFMDPDVVALMRERFVGLSWRYGMTAPIQRPEVYGFGKSVFGASVVFFTPEGRPVGDTFTFTPFFLEAYMRRVLARSPEAAGAPIKAKAPLARARAHLRRGELAAARKLLTPLKTAAAHQLLASAHRRERHGVLALKELSKAWDLDSTRAVDMALDAAVIHLRSRDFPGAAKRLRAVLQGHPKHRRAPEALYHLAIADGMSGRLTAAKASWRRLTRQHPKSRWAWKAAADLRNVDRGLGASKAYWADARAFELAHDNPSSPLPVTKIAQAKRDAVTFLLRAQRPDGAWFVPNHVGHSSPAKVTAVTAICASSLLPFRQRKDVRRAIDRALAYVLAVQRSGVLAVKGPTAFQSAIWARCFVLRCLAECARLGVGDRATHLTAMQAILTALAKTQATGGGWAYVNMREIGGNQDPSIGFVTAAVVLSLHEARAAGAKVSDQLLRRAVRCVAGLKGPAGSFAYMKKRAAPQANAESSLRSPLYALALLRAGKGSVAGVRAALDLYVKHRLHVRKERGKSLCHTGPEGHASYYLLFGYRFAAEALRALPKGQRTAYRVALLADVLAARTEDGGFLDNPGVGRTCGAAFALTALEHLRDE